jgi:hypothetical protein
MEVASESNGLRSFPGTTGTVVISGGNRRETTQNVVKIGHGCSLRPQRKVVGNLLGNASNSVLDIRSH